MITFTEAAKLGFSRTFDFTGRSSRSEYWWFILAIFLGEIAVMMAVGVLPFLGIVAIPLYIWVLIASLSAMFRRVRDAGSNAWLPVWIIILGLVYGVVMTFAMFEQMMLGVAAALGLAYVASSLYLLYVLIKPSAAE